MTRKKRRKKYQPTLRFTAFAWSKLLFFRDLGGTEIGGFGISSECDPLLIKDVVLLKQSCTSVTVKFDDMAVADYFDEQINLGRKPEQFARCWLHTHPADSAEPSSTDERTFARVFGACNWSLMFVLAKGGARYARLRFSRPEASIQIRTQVDWSEPFAKSDQAGWFAEYQSTVDEVPLLTAKPARPVVLDDWDEREFATAFW